MAAITSVSQLHSSLSSLYPNYRSSPLILAPKTNQDTTLCCLTVRSFTFSRRRLSSQSVPRGLIIQNAATKPAKSPAEEDWKTKRELLLQKRVRSVEAKEALRLQKENNFVILDVRPEAEFKEAHPPGAINVQIYRLIKEWTAWDIARRAAFAFFGIFSGTEENPEFLQSIAS
ncbi:Rhodanese domain-containing protein [Citrus sinensis]|uniref:Rhodanese domain-containing protein n=1 Tax=Citrus clementina TaxID=85681 RepID=V4TLY0_CITCL|nr:hypothetical protein CICLE_v10021946mg [Citrus x clementina]KAH9724299.1 Rhodanese domain-containing protein [Citrus sinensis]